MPSRNPPTAARHPRPKRRKKSKWQLARERWRERVTRWALLIGRVPPAVRTLTLLLALAGLMLLGNLLYQVMRKPTEMFFPVSGALDKSPADSWRHYGSLFRDNATATITADLLAALAQVESAANPVARTYWRFRLSADPFEIYRPASSSVGMYQMTDPAFADARHFCIRHHQLVRDGAWDDWHGCWFNRFYLRVLPGSAIELTAASLDHAVTTILGSAPASLAQKQDLAALIHLCGPGPARDYAQRHFQLRPGERCGDHDPAAYLAQVEHLKRVFQKLDAAS